MLLLQLEICECLKISGLDPTRLQQISPYGAGGPGILAGSHRHSWVEMGARGSVIEIANGPQDVDSVSSSPGMTRVSFIFHKHIIIYVCDSNYCNILITDKGTPLLIIPAINYNL